MIKASNETLAQGIKSVSRGVNTDVDEDKTYVLITKNTKLFCPVLSNLFSLTGLSGNDQE
ncbi:MAG: hypothetical protein MJ201_01180 [Mycoplasmoidaceae bacterium]|nr:hypothetical protein [Mycoplasmoidaceae bacterium]